MDEGWLRSGAVSGRWFSALRKPFKQSPGKVSSGIERASGLPAQRAGRIPGGPAISNNSCRGRDKNCGDRQQGWLRNCGKPAAVQGGGHHWTHAAKAVTGRLTSASVVRTVDSNANENGQASRMPPKSMQKLNREEIRLGLERVNAVMEERGVLGELCLFGGACLCLAFSARDSTKDVDAVFKPASELRKAAFDVAVEMGWPSNWLNDDVSGFLSIRGSEGIELLASFELSHLKVFAAKADYILAMKCLAARFGGSAEDGAPSDLEDALWLCRHLGLSGREAIARIVLKYYPDLDIPERSVAFVEELSHRLSETR